jgi:glycosyltransferase involved in cell wall biosynthesis
MNITFINKKLDLKGGGSNFSLDLVARQLVERGHEVDIVTLCSSDNNIPQTTPYDLLTYNIEKNSYIRMISSVYNIMSKYEHRTDIFHIFNPRIIPGGGIYNILKGNTPVVGRLNSFDMPFINSNCNLYKNPLLSDSVFISTNKIQWLKATIKKYTSLHLLNQVDSLFAISPSVKHIYTSQGVIKHIITVIPNFYNPEFGNETTVDNKVAIQNESPTEIIYVGRLVQWKGVDTLIDAIEYSAGEINVSIIGEGEERSQLEQQANKKDVEVTFHGHVENRHLPQYYNESDIFVHPAKQPEAFGRTLLEAMQYNNPIVVSDEGAGPWVTRSAGMIFNSRDPQSLATSLSHIINSPVLYENMKSNCKSELSRFRPKVVVEKIEEEYSQLLE